MKTSELIGPALDWAVAKCVWTDRPIVAKAGCRISVPVSPDSDPNDSTLRFFYEPSIDWSQGGPIIEREKISAWLHEDGTQYRAAPKEWMLVDPESEEFLDMRDAEVGPTPLIAVMRCLCASKLGDEVEIPEELK